MTVCQNSGGDIPYYDLSFYVGDDDRFIFYWSTKHIDPETGVEIKAPVDMTGYTAEMHFRDDYITNVNEPVVYNGVPVVYKTEAVETVMENPPVHTEVGVIDPLLGKTTFTLTKTELRTLFGDSYAKKTYIHDVQVTDPSGLNRTLLLGNVVLTNDVTRI